MMLNCVAQVRYHIQQESLVYGCASYAVATAANNVTMAAVASGNCASNFFGYYANSVCEYCCLSNLCNRDKTSSWIKTDCDRLRSQASVTMATATVVMTTVTSWRLILPAA